MSNNGAVKIAEGITLERLTVSEIAERGGPAAAAIVTWMQADLRLAREDFMLRSVEVRGLRRILAGARERERMA